MLSVIFAGTLQPRSGLGKFCRTTPYRVSTFTNSDCVSLEQPQVRRWSWSLEQRLGGRRVRAFCKTRSGVTPGSWGVWPVTPSSRLGPRGILPTPVHHHRTPTPCPTLTAIAAPPKPDRRRALELLAASADGCTEALMFANGFTAELLLELVRAGLASAHAERVVADGRMMEVTRVKISEADGRQ
jgi:hypothetical protein